MTDDCDVIIVGAGLAGAATAAVLGRQGRRVAIVDPEPTCKPAFKAEKIEPDQADLFRRLALFEQVVPHAARVRTITEGHSGRRIRSRLVEQYGIRYQDMVNAVRRQIPASVYQHTARVVGVDGGRDLQVVRLSSGNQLTGRLVVVATGTEERLRRPLHIERELIRARHSLCTGFDVEPGGGGEFLFDAVTYWSDRLAESIDYASFFPVPGAMRVNLFSYHDPRDPWVRELGRDPAATVSRAIPRLTRVTAGWRAASRVETRAIDLYVVRTPVRDGIAFVGDAFQSVCPATGTGLSKVLTDVERLCQVYVPAWLETPGMGKDKISAFYSDPAKRECDRQSLRSAEYRRRFATDRSLKWWLHRRRTFAGAAFDRIRRRSQP